VEKAKIKPMIVQNRCFANQGWDRNIRKICRANKIIYQGFSLLTANPFVLQNQKLVEIAKSLQRTPIQVIFRFSTQIGILPLTGTTQINHMKEDLQIFDFEISQNDLKTIETLYIHHS
jgi:diketogulonate reductase-like aldo/keto reductase